MHHCSCLGDDILFASTPPKITDLGHELPSNSLVRIVDPRTAPPTATLSNAAIFHMNDAGIGFPLQSFDFLSRLASYSAPYFENDQCS